MVGVENSWVGDGLQSGLGCGLGGFGCGCCCRSGCIGSDCCGRGGGGCRGRHVNGVIENHRAQWDRNGSSKAQ